VCPTCSLRFGVDRDGTVVAPGNRPEDRVQPGVLNVPGNVRELVAKLPDSIVQRVRQEFVSPDQQQVLEMLACFGIEPHETGGARVLDAILDRSHGRKEGIRELVITAKRDWRDVLW